MSIPHHGVKVNLPESIDRYCEKITLVIEQTTPTSEQTTPTSEQTTPTSEQTTPTSEQTNSFVFLIYFYWEVTPTTKLL